MLVKILLLDPGGVETRHTEEQLLFGSPQLNRVTSWSPAAGCASRGSDQDVRRVLPPSPFLKYRSRASGSRRWHPGMDVSII